VAPLLPPLLIVVMGPSGCGKSSVGGALADRLGVAMLEGDDFHPEANRQKMASGAALSDEDRLPWLDAVDAELSSRAGETVVLACSALTPYVQTRLRGVETHLTRFFMLLVPSDTLAKRMEARADHFMPASLLESQIAALQVPADARVFDGSESVSALAQHMAAALND